MRKTCPSAKALCRKRFSSRALARSWPNGFSMISRDQGEPCAFDRARPASRSRSAIGPKKSGCVAR